MHPAFEMKVKIAMIVTMLSSGIMDHGVGSTSMLQTK